MIYGSVCSGIEAATMAWRPLNSWRPAFYSEIADFPKAVLRYHHPQVPLHGDFTSIRAGDYEPIELLVGGTPCQDFSIAGLRAGLAGERGNLTLEFLRLADRLRPTWIIWENVPGVLSIDDGRAFGSFLGGLAQLGYGTAYRVLDAQYSNLAQRRERVFVIGCLGDWRRAAAVLFERESLCWNPPPRREAGQRVAPTIASRPTGGGGLGTDFDCDGALIAHALNAKGGSGRIDYESETFVIHALRAEGFDASEDGTGRGIPITLAIRGRGDSHDLEWRQDGVANAVLTPNGGRAGIGVGAVAFNITPSNSNKDYNARQAEYAQAVPAGGNRPSARGGDLIAFTAKDHGADAGELAPTLRAGGHSKSHANAGVMPAVATSMAVRRLTPRECERLQGFPDDYTLVPYRKKLAADGPRYKALGNSMAVPVMRWIGERINAINELG